MIFLKAELTRLPHDGAPKNTANQGPVIDRNHHVLCDPDSTGGSMIPRISLASPRRPRANQEPAAQGSRRGATSRHAPRFVQVYPSR